MFRKLIVYEMEDDKFEKLMSEIQKSQRVVEDKLATSQDKFATSLAEFRKEVNSIQERTTNELSQKISKSNYTFQKKGHEHQFILILVFKTPLQQLATS